MSRGPAVSSNGQIQRAASKPQSSLVSFIENHQQDIAMVLPKHITPDRMARLAISAVRTTKGLDRCSLVSFAGCIMACSSLGLEPNSPLGHAYLIPYKGECTLVIGYKGLIDLMYRSGYVASVKAEPVFDGDAFEYEKGLNPKLRHVPCGEDHPDKLTHVYTIVRWKDGGEPIWDVLTRSQIESRMKRSASAGSSYSPWRTDFCAMSLKTGVRAIAKWAPSATERLTQAVAYEQQSELGRPASALSVFGEQPQRLLESAGAFPVDDDGGPDGVPVPDADAGEERQPGEDG